MDILFETIQHPMISRLLAATVIGGMIGLEREFQKKDAGLKTFILICCGSAIYTALSPVMGGDEARIASQIVSGVGFLGAGAIFKDADRISGLTTAAFMWVVAALGIVVGSGEIALGLLLAFGMLITIMVVGFVEHHVKRKVS